ncbi:MULTISPECIES: hypothetical protein [unclassified Rathayibacter]|uniref:hypothetical protein n=1 Tax=unclassified Rathayibacter TaxID=2609250 RepID=UPI0011B0DAC7|nr:MULTISPECIES: hypothetical protein [unclassified Rathayibacter]
MSVAFEGLLGLDYHQILLNSQLYDDVIYDEAFEGSSNELVGASAPGSLCLMTGSATGYLRVRVVVSDREPELGTWEDIIEVPFEPKTSTLSLMSLFPDVTYPSPLVHTMVRFELAGGSYRARWSIRGFQAAWDLVSDGPTPDEYQLDLWPAPPVSESVRRRSGTIG